MKKPIYKLTYKGKEYLVHAPSKIKAAKKLKESFINTGCPDVNEKQMENFTPANN